MARKNPETVVVSGFSEPISFSVRNVGCGGRTRFCLCDGDLQGLVLRIYPVGVPGALLADRAATSLTDPGHSLASFLPPPAAVGSLPQRATLAGLITRRSGKACFASREKKKAIPVGMTFSFLASRTDLDIFFNSLINFYLSRAPFFMKE